MDEKKPRQVEIPVIFDGDRVIFQCGKCGYIVECNFKDKMDLEDFFGMRTSA